MAELLIDVLVNSKRWILDKRYRTRMLERPTSHGTWRFICRRPEGGIQIVACVSFCSDGRTRTIRAPLRDVVR